MPASKSCHTDKTATEAPQQLSSLVDCVQVASYDLLSSEIVCMYWI